MIMHNQTIETGPGNDSLRACLATILDFKDIRTVPIFKHMFGTKTNPFKEWLRERGLEVMILKSDDVNRFITIKFESPSLFIMSGPSRAGDIQHVVCGADKKKQLCIIHNPSNTNKPFEYEKPGWTLYFISKKAI